MTEQNSRAIDHEAARLRDLAPQLLAALRTLSRLCLQDNRYVNDAEFHHATRLATELVRLVEEGPFHPSRLADFVAFQVDRTLNGDPDGIQNPQGVLSSEEGGGQ